MLRHTTLLMLSLPLTMLAATAPYVPDFKTGTLPPELSIANCNSLKPDANGYKRGWTADGWTVDRYGTKGYVLLSPTYTGSSTACENRLSLPALGINAGDFLSWQALSVHPDFPEAYRVEITADGSTRVLFSTESEQTRWATRMIPLSEYAGKEAVISFVCTSCNRYMLALDAIKVDTPSGLNFETLDSSDVYHGPAENADIKLEILNCGGNISDGTLRLTAGGYSESLPIENIWPTNQWRSFTLHAPLTPDTKTDYTVSFEPADGGESVILSRKSVYSSVFAKRLLVDKGTGMWCTNCPEGILQTEALKNRFGSALTVLETHCTTGSPESDPLANETYFNELGYRSVPMLMLDRIRSTAGTNASDFDDYLFTPAKFAVSFTGLTLAGNDNAEISVSVKAAGAIDNSSDRYRIGYVLSADIHDPDNKRYTQRNNCTQPTAERFFFLPAKIPPALCVFHNVTLSSATTFSGFSNSMPADIEPLMSYGYTFGIERPELVSDINRLHVTVFVLDSESGQIMTSGAIEIGKADITALPRDISAGHGDAVLNVSADGLLHVWQPRAADFNVQIFDIAGHLCRSLGGNAAESAHALDLPKGAYLLRFTGSGEVKTIKFTL